MQEEEIIQTADAVTGSWVYRMAPEWMRPYLKLARMDRPVGTWLLLWPCWWSVAMSTQAQGPYFSATASVFVCILFAIGAVVMRGAGCTYNDIVDKDFDAQVERTRSRPIPSGEVSLKQAWGFLVFQCCIGFVVLLLLSPLAIKLGFASLLLVLGYPFMKRITYWPQAWLGLTFNWGALMGWAAMTNSLTAAPILLYIGGVFWTLGYDTIYAHQDVEDDALIGVKSSAIALGEKTKIGVTIFYGLFIICLICAGMLAKLGIFYYIGLAVAALDLSRQVIRLDINDGGSCLKVFRSNISFGWIILIAIVADQF